MAPPLLRPGGSASLPGYLSVPSRTIVAFLLAAAITALVSPLLARADEQYPYPYPPPLPIPIVRGGELRFLVEPQHAQVFVDGYYSGIAGDYGGLFRSLHVPPGDREIALYLAGYRTVRQKLSVAPGATYKLHYSMEKLAPGVVSEPPPANAAAVQGPPGPPAHQLPPPPLAPPPPQVASTSNFGTLVIHVQPAGTEILIDGDRWNGPEGEERLLIQVAEGPHRVEIFKDGQKRFSTEIEIRRGETRSLNVSLPPDLP